MRTRATTKKSGEPKKPRKSKFNNAKSLGFDSMLEVTANTMLTESGILFDYTPQSIELKPSFKQCFYMGEKGLMKQKCVARNVSYTPDFIAKDKSWYLETKGLLTDVFAMRWKLFRYWITENNPDALLMIAHNKAELSECIKLIQSHLENKKNRNG